MTTTINSKETGNRRKAAFDAIRAAKLEHLRKISTMPDEELLSIVKNTKFADHTANALTACITSYLQYNALFFTRQQSQGQYNTKLQKFTKSTVKKGVSDTYTVINGQYLAIEVKVGRDKIRKDQEMVKAQVEQSGGLYYIATDWPSTYEFLQQVINKGK